MPDSAGLSVSTPSARAGESGADRYLAFAFAAADMLVEADLDGIIGFAAGAFRSRLGIEAEQTIGRSITSLFAPSDHETLEVALAMARHSGRIAPVVLRLADRASTQVSVGALMLDVNGRPPRLHFTIGPLPTEADATASQIGPLADKRSFARIAEAALRGSAPSNLGLVEVTGWDRIRETLSPVGRRELEADLNQAMVDSAPGGTAGTLDDGKYGVLAPNGIDLDGMMGRLKTILRGNPAAVAAGLGGSVLQLEAGGLSGPQAARALRYALDRFAEGGQKAADAAGGRAGLAGIVATAGQQAVAVQEALSRRRFSLLYQPIARLQDRCTSHYEALLRPNPNARLPMRNTQEFVTFVEAVGMTEELDWAVLETAILALQETKAASVAINMSGLTFQNPAYRKRMMARFAELAAEGDILANRRLMIELTETVEIRDLEAAAVTMEQLRTIGVPVCLDDFGAGASAFRYLRAFRVDFVKLDGAYVRSACTSARERSLVGSMITMATNAGAKVVAEMIETEEQMKIMRDLGVQYGQGWLFGRPGRLPGRRSSVMTEG